PRTGPPPPAPPSVNTGSSRLLTSPLRAGATSFSTSGPEKCLDSPASRAKVEPFGGGRLSDEQARLHPLRLGRRRRHGPAALPPRALRGRPQEDAAEPRHARPHLRHRVPPGPGHGHARLGPHVEPDAPARPAGP